MSFGGGGGSGEIRYVISVDDSQAISKLDSISQSLSRLEETSTTTSQKVSELSPALDNVKDSSDKVKESSNTAGPSIASVGTAVAFAASSVISLVQQYTSLKRAQNTLERAQNVEKGQVIAITKQREKYNDTVEKYGKNSKEARMELDKLNLLEDKHKTQVEKIGLLQESLSQRMMSFAFSVVPTTIGVVSGLAQTFQILGNGRGGAGGMKGVLGLIGRFGPPLLILGGFLLAVKFNLFGIRDALDGFGKALGDAMPALKPALNAIRDLGVVIGLVPGNAEEAQKRLKKFGGGVIAWSKDVAGAIGKIFDKLKSGDIKGALDDIKAGLKTAFDITVGSILFDGKPLSKWIDQLITFFQVDMKQHGAWTATVDTLNIAFKTFIWPSIVPEAQKALKKMQADIQSVFNNPAGAGLGGIVLDISNFITMAKKGDTSNEKFENWLSTQIGLLKVTLKQKFIEFKNWVLTQPILGDVIKALFPGQKGSTLEGLDISGAIFTFLDDHLVKPLQQGWATAVDTVYKFLIKNPIIKQIIDFVFAPGASLKLPDIAGWFEKNVGKPLRDAWNTFIKELTSFFSDHSVSGAIGAGLGIKQGGTHVDFTQSEVSKLPESFKSQFPSTFKKGRGGNFVPIDSVTLQPKSVNISLAGVPVGDVNLHDLVFSGGMGNGSNFGGNNSNRGSGSGSGSNFLQIPIAGVQLNPATTTVNLSNTVTNFAQDTTIIAALFSAMAKSISESMGIIAQNSKDTGTAIKQEFGKAVSASGKVFSSLSKHWNNMAVNIAKAAANSAKQITNSFSSMVSSVGKAMSALSKHWNSMCLNMIKAAKSAAKQIASALHSIPDEEVRINIVTTRTTRNVAQGFHRGQHGLHETVNQPTLFLAGEAGKERVDITPGMGSRNNDSNGSGKFGVINQTVNLQISGSDIINERVLTKKIKLTVGENRDRFG